MYLCISGFFYIHHRGRGEDYATFTAGISKTTQKRLFIDKQACPYQLKILSKGPCGISQHQYAISCHKNPKNAEFFIFMVDFWVVTGSRTWSDFGHFRPKNLAIFINFTRISQVKIKYVP